MTVRHPFLILPKLPALVAIVIYLLIEFLPAKREAELQTHPVVAEKELLITDPAVVDSIHASYPGALSFGHLMEQLAGDEDVSNYVVRWLESWESHQSINGHTVEARREIGNLLIDPWKAKDGFADSSRDKWQVDLSNAPFRLLAVVNRIDMSGAIKVEDGSVTFGDTGKAGYYEGTAPNGEVRLVFGAIDQLGEPLAGGFTAIFEYALPEVEFKKRLRSGRIPDTWGAGPFPKPTAAQKSLNARRAVAKYAARWHSLGAFEEFDKRYLESLVDLVAESTDRAFQADCGPPLLAQLRTNEGAFGKIQEAREFDYVKGKLLPAAVAATPDIKFMQDKKIARALTKFINDNDDTIQKSMHTIPVTVDDPRDPKKKLPFLAGSALMPKIGVKGDEFFYWDAGRVRNSKAMRAFSLNTCSGCHCGETKTGFYHISPRRAGEASKLSDFLKIGASELQVDPPDGRGRKAKFNEMAHRTVIFEALLNPGMDESQIARKLRHRTRGAH